MRYGLAADVTEPFVLSDLPGLLSERDLGVCGGRLSSLLVSAVKLVSNLHSATNLCLSGTRPKRW